MPQLFFVNVFLRRLLNIYFFYCMYQSRNINICMLTVMLVRHLLSYDDCKYVMSMNVLFLFCSNVTNLLFFLKLLAIFTSFTWCQRRCLMLMLFYVIHPWCFCWEDNWRRSWMKIAMAKWINGVVIKSLFCTWPGVSL